MEPVTDHHRRLLHQQVEAVTSTEAADTLMAHLPQGGTQALATKADVATETALLRADLAVVRSDLERKIDSRVAQSTRTTITALTAIMLAVATASVTISQVLK